MGRATITERNEESTEIIRLLMVEDSEDDYLLARGFLESARRGQYEVEWAPTYDEGLQRLASGRYDLCLLDYHLGDRTGLQLLSAARQRGVDLPFVILTNQKEPELDSRALQLGAADFLSKPRMDPELLHRSVRFAVHHHRMNADLRARQERVTRAALAARDGIWDWNFHTDRLQLSEQWQHWLPEAKIAPEETPAHLWREHVHPEDRPEFERRLRDHLEGRAATFQLEYRMRSPGDEWRWMHVRGLASARGEGRVTGFQSDITERKLLELRLERDAHHDALTGLANRNVLLQKLNAVLSRGGLARTCALLYVDLDDFKEVNEQHGHLAGDRVLVEVARRIEDALRCNDTAARMGGDEFVALLEGVGSEAEAQHVVRRMAAAIRAPIRLEEGSVRVTASFGVALGSPGYERPQEWLRDADSALFEAKRHGKARANVHRAPDGGVRTAVSPSRGSLPAVVRATSLGRVAEERRAGTRAPLRELDERISLQPILSLYSGRMEAARLRLDPHPARDPRAGELWPHLATRYERWIRLGWISPAARIIVSSFEAGPQGLGTLPEELRSSFLLERPYEPGLPPRRREPSGSVHALGGFRLEYEALRSLVRAQPEVLLADARSLLDCREEDWDLFQVFLQLIDDLGVKVVADGLATGGERDLVREAGIQLGCGLAVAPWLSLSGFSAWLRPGRAA